ncbi:unnamed protein product [Rangifer tarandus platyrhynchus]|uniref:Uncharacterized protein n=1 Tax=Rangifer tarandus platyrhynchus TaxID=3082113 RepID=A0ABN8Y395_RANTA|nr:unnamed protein product [Rangifer tarandus platyrhynchus]
MPSKLPRSQHMCADTPHAAPKKRADFLQTDLRPPRLLGQVSGFVWRQMVDKCHPGAWWRVAGAENQPCVRACSVGKQALLGSLEALAPNHSISLAGRGEIICTPCFYFLGRRQPPSKLPWCPSAAHW